MHILSLLPFLPLLVSAQDPTIIYPTTALPSATSLPSLGAYTYIGCYNETTSSPSNARALQGNFSANNTLTISTCLNYCSTIPSAQYAGIEYGRECYCSPYLSAFAEPVNESRCAFACNGNASEICGGALALSLYNRTGDSKTGTAWSVVGRRSGGGGAAEWYGFAGLVALVIAAVL